ncbi:parallel beta-helix repeat protein [Vibrio phage 1.185.O._10N.286.49.C2]|nr:parallel beta-helix repeat protein [Vibrio phage 1.185.O._10N.286.49.C2]
MATQVKHRRGTNAEILAGTPAIGELWFNTTDNTIHMGDGITQGGVKHLNVDIASFVYVETLGVKFDGATDNTLAIQAVFDKYPAGMTFVFSSGQCLTDRVFPKSNTTIIFNSKTEMVGVTNGNNIIRLSDVDNIHLIGNGCKWTRDETGTSHNLYLESARNIVIENINFESAGAAKDCIYVGEGGAGPSENVVIRGGSTANANRNGISIVACNNVLIDNVKICDTTGSPGAGIDIEANNFDKVAYVTIRKCNIYNNATAGIFSVFGEKVTIEDNWIHDNGAYGIGCSAGGAQFEDDVYRNQDRRGVTSFSATGEVGIPFSSQDDTVLSLPVGTIVQFVTKNGAELPTELRIKTRWVVSEHSVSNNSCKLAPYLDVGQINSYTQDFSGSLNSDPTLSDIEVLCFVPGQNSDYIIQGNHVENNGLVQTSVAEIFFTTGVNVFIKDNFVKIADRVASGIQTQYTRYTEVTGNTVEPYNGANATNAIGLNYGQCSYVNSTSNRVINLRSYGVTIDGGSKSRFYGDEVHNCGITNNYPVRIRNTNGALIDGYVVTQNIKNTPTNGIVADTNVSNTIFQRCNVKDAGVDNASSLNVIGASNILVNNVLHDGVLTS